MSYGLVGDAPVPEGLITVTCKFADSAANCLSTNFGGNNGLYEGANMPGVFSIVPDKLAVIMDDFPTDSLGAGPAALISLNGIGKPEKEDFTNDEDMQIASVMNRMRPLGVTLQGSVYDQKDGNRGTGFVVGLSCKFRGLATVADMPAGMFYRWRMIKPSEYKDNSRAVAKGDELGRYRAEMVPVPVTPESFYDLALTSLAHIDNYYNSKEKYLYSMGSKRKNTDVWSTFATNMGNFSLTSGLHFMHYMLKNGFVSPPLFYFDPIDGGVHTDPESSSWPDAIKALSRSTRGAKRDIITLLMEASARSAANVFGLQLSDEQLRKAVSSAKKEVYPDLLKDLHPKYAADVVMKRAAASMGVVNAVYEPEVADISPRVMDEMSDRSVDIINTVFLRGDIENYEFGFLAESNIGVTKANGVVAQNLNGKILENQYNSYKRAVASFMDAAINEIQWIGGKVTSAGCKGDTFEAVQGKGFL